MSFGFGGQRQNANATVLRAGSPKPAYMADALPRYLDGSHRPGREIRTWRQCVLGHHGFFFLCSAVVGQEHPLASVHRQSAGTCVVMTWWTDIERLAVEFANEFGTGVFSRATPLDGQHSPVRPVAYPEFFRRGAPELSAVFPVELDPAVFSRASWLSRVLARA